MTSVQGKKVAVMALAATLVALTSLSGCSTPRKAAEEPATITTVTLQAPETATVETKIASLGASSSGRSR